MQLRASKPIREGLEIATPGGIVRVLGREDGLWRVKMPGGPMGSDGSVESGDPAESGDSLDSAGPAESAESSGQVGPSESGRPPESGEFSGPGDPLEFFERWGEVPLPPYIHRSADASDREPGTRAYLRARRERWRLPRRVSTSMRRW